MSSNSISRDSLPVTQHPSSHVMMLRRILRARDICAALGIGKSTLYAWIADGRFPASDIRLGPHTVGWDPKTIEAFIDANRVLH